MYEEKDSYFIFKFIYSILFYYCINYSEICVERQNSKISLLDGDIVDRIGLNKLDYLINDVEWWLVLDSTYDEFVGSSFVAYINGLGQ